MIVAMTALSRPEPSQYEVQFRVSYDGPEVQAGRMEIRDLAPAMLSMAQLIEHSAQVLHGTNASIRVEIKADFRQGSFSFAVVALTEIGRQIAESVDIDAVLKAIGIAGTGLFGLLKWLRGRKVREVVRTDSDNVSVVTEDGDTMTVSNSTVLIFNNSQVRVDASGVVEPLRKDGITEFRAGRGDVAEVTVTTDDARSFDSPPPAAEQVLQDKVASEIVAVAGLSFEGGRKWRLRLADGTPFTSELDAAFMRRVGTHDVVFGAGDLLEIELRTVTFHDGTHLRATREVIRVVRHIPAPKQLDLLEPPR